MRINFWIKDVKCQGEMLLLKKDMDIETFKTHMDGILIISPSSVHTLLLDL